MKKIPRTTALWEGDTTLSADQLATIQRAGVVALTPTLIERLQKAYEKFAIASAWDSAAIPASDTRRRLAAISTHAANARDALGPIIDGTPAAEAARDVLQMVMHSTPILRDSILGDQDLRNLGRSLDDLVRAANIALASPALTASTAGRPARSPGIDDLMITADEIFTDAGGFHKKRQEFRQAIYDAVGHSTKHAPESAKRLPDKARLKRSKEAKASGTAPLVSHETKAGKN